MLIVKFDNVRVKRNIVDGVCSEGVFLMVYMIKKLVVVVIKFEMKFNIVVVMVGVILIFFFGK